MAQSERVEQGLLAERRKREQRVITAQDDWGLVEVGVNGDGEVVEVAINTALLDKVGPTELAEAMLEAARAAQQRSKALRH
jgi:DNA-binding protein YbaB